MAQALAGIARTRLDRPGFFQYFINQGKIILVGFRIGQRLADFCIINKFFGTQRMGIVFYHNGHLPFAYKSSLTISIAQSPYS